MHNLNNEDIKDIQNMMIDILQNIKILHSNIYKDQKSNILSLVGYNELKEVLLKFGFVFQKNQFDKATEKRSIKNFGLNSYNRSIPYSKTKLSKETIKKLIQFMDKNSYFS